MKKRIIAIALAFLLPIAGCKSAPRNASGYVPGDSANARSQASEQTTIPGSGFDFYLLNLSWSPEFCHSHPNAGECAAHAAFVLHGLWPENTDGSYPESCSNAPGPADTSQYRDIYPDPGLLEHEWQTHGTCSGLSTDTFFQTARSAVRAVAIPQTLNTLTSQTSLPPDQIVDLFTASNPAIPRSSFVVSCGHNYLTAVEVCLDKSLHPVPCTAVRSCRANTVRIPPP
jgi:ribonuclease T2